MIALAPAWAAAPEAAIFAASQTAGVKIDTTSLLERARADHRLAGVLEAVRELDGVWLVGGAVRDVLLGRQAPDVDLVVEGTVDAATAALRSDDVAAIVVHDRFGTAR